MQEEKKRELKKTDRLTNKREKNAAEQAEEQIKGTWARINIHSDRATEEDRYTQLEKHA